MSAFEFYHHDWLPIGPRYVGDPRPTLVLDLVGRHALVIVRATDQPGASLAYVVKRYDGGMIATIARVLDDQIAAALPYIVARAQELVAEATPAGGS